METPGNPPPSGDEELSSYLAGLEDRIGKMGARLLAVELLVQSVLLYDPFSLSTDRVDAVLNALEGAEEVIKRAPSRSQEMQDYVKYLSDARATLNLAKKMVQKREEQIADSPANDHLEAVHS